MFSEKIAEALAGTQPIAIVGDTARDALYSAAATWGFQLASASASEIAMFADTHPILQCNSSGSWILVIEGADTIGADLEDMVLDLVFDGSPGLPANTLIAVHFSKYCEMSEALSDDDVPITYLEMDTADDGPCSDEIKACEAISSPIYRQAPTDKSSVQLAA